MKKTAIIAVLAAILLAPCGASADTMRLQERIRSYAAEYGVDAVTADAIIYCESTYRPAAIHENRVGTTTRVWSRDWGYWQLNDHYQKTDALKAGFDITDPDQNLEYGFIILSEKGTAPWSASRPCWQPRLSTDSIANTNANTVI